MGLLKEMDERKVQADSVTCTTLINSYSKKGDMSSTCKVKRRMVESGLQLDHFTYKALSSMDSARA
jgi:pentatricopeptide repeat protein